MGWLEASPCCRTPAAQGWDGSGEGKQGAGWGSMVMHGEGGVRAGRGESGVERERGERAREHNVSVAGKGGAPSGHGRGLGKHLPRDVQTRNLSLRHAHNSVVPAHNHLAHLLSGGAMHKRRREQGQSSSRAEPVACSDRAPSRQRSVPPILFLHDSA